MGSFIDLKGKIFGRFKVLRASRKVAKNPKGNHIFWECICECGNIKEVKGYDLRRGHTKSCGCLFKEGRNNITHGHCIKGSTVEYKLLHSAKRRAKKRNLDFNIELGDIIIPKYCPILNYIELTKNVGYVGHSSPTLDRIDTNKGYTKDNIQVISFKANTMKSDGSYKDIGLLYNWAKENMTQS